MALWREKLFAAMSRNAASATVFFKHPDQSRGRARHPDRDLMIEEPRAAARQPARTARCCASAWAASTSKRNDPAAAAAHLRKALELDPKYSAAWKLLGRAYEAAGQFTAAAEAWTEGMAVAEANGDQQAAKEMKVFLKRLEKNRPKD